MSIAEIRDIQTPDLLKKVSELKQELFALRFQQGSGQMKQSDSGKMREIKKTIARILTVIKEREANK
ncbi:MAG: 50S ribosomal protein L29 [Candidatus Caccosoma sp.]|nr:50S ribosomal protein L29 [Candidatus Caccosoma sp.]